MSKTATKNKTRTAKIRKLQDRIVDLTSDLMCARRHLYGTAGVVEELLTLMGRLTSGGNDAVALTLKRLEVLMLRLKISTKEGIKETDPTLD